MSPVQTVQASCAPLHPDNVLNRLWAHFICQPIAVDAIEDDEIKDNSILARVFSEILEVEKRDLVCYDKKECRKRREKEKYVGWMMSACALRGTMEKCHDYATFADSSWLIYLPAMTLLPASGRIGIKVRGYQRSATSTRLTECKYCSQVTMHWL